jgi:lipoprotein-releasing system ATP-binding protein
MADKICEDFEKNQKKSIQEVGLSPKTFMMVKDLWKGFDNTRTRIEILKGVNFEIESGQTLAIVGASGIGKSTFLHILGTLDRPDQGNLFFNNEDVFSFNNGKLALFRNRFIGFVFQFHHLLPEFSALENVMMPCLIQGQKNDKAAKAAEQILGRVGMENRLYHRVPDLSGGEQQRVALARALVLNPMVLLADEPTGNLDKKNSEQVHELIISLNQELGMTLVVVTHNMELAALMSRRITILDGQLVEME